MIFTTALLAPIALLLPAAGAVEAGQDIPRQSSGIVEAEFPVARPDTAGTPNLAPENVDVHTFRQWQIRFVAQGYLPEGAHQVRIERQMTIRIAPRSRPVQPNSFVGAPQKPIGPQFIERKIGRCLPVSRIAGVQSRGGNDILLFLRDRRIISARLERACRARDFYSGFYLSPSKDGKLCVQRDALQSRSGANCKLTRIRQLVQVSD